MFTNSPFKKYALLSFKGYACIEEKEEVIMELYLSITGDFVMELLSHGEEVIVLSPKSLINKIKNIYSNH
jgi:predicted DNA-binding transcriptional regulator YafY